ncbi:MAG: PEP/pyruvate-binding domain-containing protein [Sandaracinaceae bacterium]
MSVTIPPQIALSRYRRFQSVMPFRVREILLVSSSYDAFVLDEDGPLTERLFSGYSELHLSQAPRITHVSSISQALESLRARRFDLVMTVAHLPDGDAAALADRVQHAHPSMPVVLLLFDEAELDRFGDGQPPAGLAATFLWSGNAGVLIAAIKLVEDARNVEHDTERAGVQVILVVEDESRAASSFLALLYNELMTQSHSLIEEGLNDQHRLMRMRGRPKILLARSYEEAARIAAKYERYLLALITDLGFPKEGRRQTRAGLDLARALRHEHPNLAVLLQSSEPDLRTYAAEFGGWHAPKRAPGFPTLVRRFLRDALGFGDFLFRLPDGTVVDKAKNVPELEEALQIVPAASVLHHASRNDFSVWLRARAMFDVADDLEPRTTGDFPDVEAIRRFLIESLQEARGDEQEGVVTDVWAPVSARQNRFIRVGTGSLGGKGRAIAYVNSLIVEHGLLRRFEGLEVRVPRTIVIGTDVYEQFLEENVGTALSEAVDPDVVRERIEAGHFPEEVEQLLREAMRAIKGPIAVRSSTLSEDSRVRSFAGVYETYMLPNTDPDPERRFAELLRAIRRVYASVYGERARSYVAGTPHSLDDEKMAVVVQQVVGRQHDARFYPDAAGVAQSYNYYPVGIQTADGGVASIVLGLGQLAVGGGGTLRFSPATPEVLPQFASAEDYLRTTQHEFCALSLDRDEARVLTYGLDVAEADGSLTISGGRYVIEDGIVRDDLHGPGVRIVTFRNVLRHGVIPLARALQVLLALLRRGLASEVEIEFALDMADWGRRLPRGAVPRSPRLYVLQVRPMPAQELETNVADLDAFGAERVLLRTACALGHGTIESIRDVVWVPRDDLDAKQKQAAGLEVGALNARLREAGRGYLLIGPGRWGTSDASLGVPVDWTDIAGARVICEVPLASGFVEPSQGTHFFHNLTASRIGYLTVTPEQGGWLDTAWLASQRARTSGLARHLELDRPLTVHMDGRRGAAIVLKPE